MSEDPSKRKQGDKSESKQDTSNTEQEAGSKVRYPPSRGRTFGATGAEKRG